MNIRRVYVDSQTDLPVRHFAPSDPFSVDCPRCGAASGERCFMLIAISTDQDGTRVEYYDPSRYVSFHRDRRWIVRN